MVCLGVKYAHGTIGSYSHSSAENACYIMCMCTEIGKYACVYVCISGRQSGILIQSVLATLLDSGPVRLESHCEIQMGDLCFANLVTVFFFCLFCFFLRVINAGKSTHNEDQASCEVLFVKKKAGASNSTPNRNSSTKRRSSLPNGEGLQLKDNSVSKVLYLASGEIQNYIKGCKNMTLKGVF